MSPHSPVFVRWKGFRSAASLLGSVLLLASCQTGGSDDALTLEEAEGSLQRIEDRMTGGGKPADIYMDLIQAGITYNSLLKYPEAEQAYRQALSVCERNIGFNAPECVDVMLRLTLQISNQGRFDEVNGLLSRAEVMVQQSTEKLDFPRYQTVMALDLANRGQNEQALDLVREATTKRRDILKVKAEEVRGTGRNMRTALSPTIADLAHGMMLDATLSFRLKRLDEAEYAAQFARRLIAESDQAPDWWAGLVDELLAQIDAGREDYAAAEERLSRALAFKQRAFGESRPVAMSLMNLGGIFRLSGRNEEALTTMDKGLTIVRDKLDDGQGLNADKVASYLATAIRMVDGSGAERPALEREMFEVSQLVRGGVTARTVAKMIARMANSDGATGEMIRKAEEARRYRDQIRLELGQLAAIPKGQRDVKKMQELASTYELARKQAEILSRQVGEKVPGFSALVASAPATVEELSALMAPDEAMLSYVLSEDGSFVFAIHNNQLSVARVPLTLGQITEKVGQLRQAFELTGGSIRPFDMRLSFELYQALVGPVASQLDGVNHVVLVPQGPLLSLPFGMLVTRNPVGLAEEAYTSARWFAQDKASSIVVSIRSFADFRSRVRPSAAPRAFIGFGNPAFTGGGGLNALASHCQIDEPIPPALVRGLTPLPGTAREVRDVASAIGGGAVFLGGTVTEPFVQRQDLGKYRMLYFATHGLLPGELKCQAEPALALTPPQSSTGNFANDGLLSASEIGAMELDADLVVLSACNTGGGDSGHLGGEALSGLARSFFSAGARSLLVSHWQVDSDATVSLMSTAFRLLQSRYPNRMAEAMRQSQIGMISSYRTSHPFFWAAFTMVGDGNKGAAPAVSRQSANAE